ncbi:MAG: glycosyltransferase family 2 protein [Chthoniobacter sp.]|nr:glycosyltransferase family 2 protein [Chthoniobacter sp.]
MSSTLTIGIPCLNESLTVGKVVDDFRRVFPAARVLVIDNRSTDDTAKIAREHGAEVVYEPRAGKGYAVQRLFRMADSDYILMADGDDTYPAEEGLKLIAAIETLGGDTVVGRRVSEEQGAFKTTHTWANNALAKLIESIFRTPVGDLFSGYRLFSRAFYRNVPLLATGFEIETEIAIQTIDKGFVQHEVPIAFRSRPEGSFSKLSTFKDGFRVIKTIVKVCKDFKPLTFFASVAGIFFLGSLLAGFFPIVDYLRFQYVYRVPLAILATGLAMLAALSLACGLILDTIVRYEREQFLLRMRNFK